MNMLGARAGFLWITWITGRLEWGARARWQKCVGLMSLYEAPHDAYMTVRAMPRENSAGCETQRL
jgi:hypothetical protein